MKKDSTIDILLATYNGEKYINDLFNSLIKQSYSNWKLIIRDDGSKDNTISLILKFQEMNPDKVELINDNEKNLGPSRSFGRLMEYSESNYIMFCDQDDIWLPDKIEKTYNKVQELELSDLSQPILVHTDLKVVSQNLSTIHESFWEYQLLDPEKNSLNTLLVQNNITGCTVMINKRLKELSIPIHKDALMHDWWLGLVASSFGKIGFLRDTTILYRQHQSNDVGAKKYSIKTYLQKVKNANEAFEIIEKIVKQADAFVGVYKESLDSKKLSIFESFSNILKLSRWKRIATVAKQGTYKNGLLRNFGFVLLLLLYRRG